MKCFTDKSIIVTGAASGIGRASAKMFAAEGGKVLCADKSPAVHETAKAIKEAGGTALSVEMDAGAQADVQALVDKAISEFGGIDVFYANAGISGGMVGLLDQLEPAWHDVLQVNLIGPLLAIQIAAPEMAKRGGGAIVCTASVAGINSGAGSPAYSASKAGVISLVKTACQNLAGSNVRVNAICPGIIETGMTKPIFDRADERGTRDRIGQLNPMRRYGQPEEIANGALFLASDQASYVNGHALVIDGGLTTSMPIIPPKPKG